MPPREPSHAALTTSATAGASRHRWSVVGVRVGVGVGIALLAAGSLTTALAGQPANPPSSTPPASAPPASTPPAAPAAPASDELPEVELTLKDGQQFMGQLVERDDRRVVLRIAGIRTTFAAENVQRLRVLPTLMERYRGLREAIDDADSEQLLRLVDWLAERRRFDLAKAELDALIKRQPQNVQAQRKRQTLERMATLAERTKAPARQTTQPPTQPPTQPTNPAATPAPTPGPAPSEPPASAPSAPAGGPPTPAAVPLLTPEQINLMKVYEIDLTTQPRVVVPPETLRKLFEDHDKDPSIPTTQEGRDALRRRPGYELLDLIFAVRARELYPTVRVLDQPESIRRFRDDVFRNWLANSCATNACHGGAEAGRFILPTRAPGTDPTVYTAFWIVNQFRLADGRPLINVEQPAQSALLQMGLPREQSAIPHPPVLRAGPGGGGGGGGGGQRDAFRPVFRSEEDPRFQAAVDWIQSLYMPRPSYTLEYQPLKPLAPAPPTPTTPPTPANLTPPPGPGKPAPGTPPSPTKPE
jgi:hypothetical protein